MRALVGKPGTVPAPSVAQTRYVQRQLDDPWPERFEAGLIAYAPDDMARFKAFMAEAELLSFYVHFDCRLGMMDLGPWILPTAIR